MKAEVTGAVVLHPHPQNHRENTLHILLTACLLGSSIGQSPGRQRSAEPEFTVRGGQPRRHRGEKGRD